MMTVRRMTVCIAVLLLSSLVVSGCWDRREINELSFIGVLGIDGEPGDVRVTAEIFRPPSQTGGGGLNGAQRTVSIAMGDGPSLLSAIRCMNRAVSRYAYGSHIVAVILGEDYARSGIGELVDLWQKSAEYRMRALLVITRGRAEDLITGAGVEIESTVAAQIEGLSRTVRIDGRVMIATIHDVIRGLLSDSEAAVTGVLTLAPSRETPVPRSPLPGEEGKPLEPAFLGSLHATGIALLKGTRLQALIPSSDISKSIVASAAGIQGSVYDIMVPPFDGADGSVGYTTTVEVTGTQARVWAETEPELKIMVEVETEIDLASQRHEREVNADEMVATEKAFEDMIRDIRVEAIRLLQSESCDVMGFAGAVHRADPKIWASIKDNWDQVFMTLPFEVKVEARLGHAGLSKSAAWKR